MRDTRLVPTSTATRRDLAPCDSTFLFGRNLFLASCRLLTSISTSGRARERPHAARRLIQPRGLHVCPRDDGPEDGRRFAKLVSQASWCVPPCMGTGTINTITFITTWRKSITNNTAKAKTNTKTKTKTETAPPPLFFSSAYDDHAMSIFSSQTSASGTASSPYLPTWRPSAQSWTGYSHASFHTMVARPCLRPSTRVCTCTSRRQSLTRCSGPTSCALSSAATP